MKSQLAAIEDLPSFGKNGFKHNLAKRQAEAEEEGGEEEEGRGWKNKEKKRKNKKEKKRRKKFDTALMEEEKERVKEAVAESETETSEEGGAEAPFTSGLQFSAYSPQPQQAAPIYKERPASYNKPQPPSRRADQILYGLDPQGKPVYMDAADVAELLGTPKAKKVKQQG